MLIFDLFFGRATVFEVLFEGVLVDVAVSAAVETSGVFSVVEGFSTSNDSRMLGSFLISILFMTFIVSIYSQMSEYGWIL